MMVFVWFVARALATIYHLTFDPVVDLIAACSPSRRVFWLVRLALFYVISRNISRMCLRMRFFYFLEIYLHIECKKRCPDTKYYGNSSSMVYCSLFSLIIFMRLCLFILSLAYNIFWESLLIISSLRCIYGRDSKKIGIFFLSDKFLHYI